MLGKLCLATALVPLAAVAADLPIFDAHLQYGHDAWESVPPAQAIAILRKAGVKRALVSSSGNDGQQRLAAQAPDLIIPELRPYRSRADTGTWFRDETVVPYLENVSVTTVTVSPNPSLQGGRTQAGAPELKRWVAK